MEHVRDVLLTGMASIPFPHVYAGLLGIPERVSLLRCPALAKPQRCSYPGQSPCSSCPTR
ncbi:hypothetical protein LZ30DRAFT_730283 [Colletotrichum cereale]|nr:hypothetical protein LZ30DRAFT_730283 [Colletotrichum cereale]